MEPITHALTSLALSRAGLNKTTRLATPLLLASGLMADLDYASLLAGPGAYLRFHRALAHSLLGSAILIVLLTGAAWLLARNHPKSPLRFVPLLAICAAGAGSHLLLDLCDSSGVQLLWPFDNHRFAWDLVARLDPWILVLLVAGLLLPGLFRLVSEEIGERGGDRGPRRGAIVALSLLALYLGARGVLHARAVTMLLSREYHGAAPQAAGAFPSAVSPLEWRGVVATANAFDELDVPQGPGGDFNPDRSLTRYKPEPSPALDAAQSTATARTFLKYARFPLASLERSDDGYRFTLHDLRFTSKPGGIPHVIAVVELDSQLRVTREELRFDSSPRGD